MKAEQEQVTEQKRSWRVCTDTERHEDSIALYSRMRTRTFRKTHRIRTLLAGTSLAVQW